MVAPQETAPLLDSRGPEEAAGATASEVAEPDVVAPQETAPLLDSRGPEEAAGETASEVAEPDVVAPQETAPLLDSRGPEEAAGETATEVAEPEPLAPEEQAPLFDSAGPAEPAGEAQLKAVIEAIVYVTEEPVTAAQIAAVVQRPEAQVRRLLEQLMSDYAAPERGIMVREVAGGYKMATKPEHHEALRAFAKSLKPPLKLSLAALETLATIAYKQPITAPEIMEIRGVQGAGVLKTLLDRKLIQTAGRKNVVGKPILYRTTKEFLVQFGLKDLSELPTLKEFEDLRRLAVSEPAETPPAESADASGTPPEDSR